MKNIKINKKILFILIFAFIVILLNTHDIFATVDIPQEVLEKNTTVGYNENNVILYNYKNGYYYICYSSTEPSSINNWRVKGSSNIDYLIDPSYNTFYYIYFNPNTSIWSSPKTSPDDNGLALWLVSGDNVVLWSKYDIVYSQRAGHTDGEVFFQPAPVVEEPILEGTLAPIVAEIPETKEVLQEIITLLPMILSVLVSLLALRKALRTLLTFLRTS